MPTRNSSTESNGGERFLRIAPRRGARAKRSFLLLALVVGIPIALSSLLGENGLPTFLRLRGEEKILQHDVESLRARAAELENDVDALETDPEALERLVREKYRMRRPGEEVIEVVGEDLLADDPQSDGAEHRDAP